MRLVLAALSLFVVVECCAQQAVPPSGKKAPGTDARAKINSQLLQAIDRAAGQTKNLPTEPPTVDIDDKGRALVDVRADVTSSLHSLIKKLGGTVVSSDKNHRSTIARVPLARLETLAEDAGIRSIEPAAEAITNRKKEAL